MSEMKKSAGRPGIIEKGHAFGSRGAQAGNNIVVPNAITAKVPVTEDICAMQTDKLQMLVDKVVKSNNGELKEVVLGESEDKIIQLVKRIAEMYSQGKCIERTLMILCGACNFDIGFENRVKRWRENFWKTKEVGFSEPDDLEYIKSKIVEFKERVTKENGNGGIK